MGGGETISWPELIVLMSFGRDGEGERAGVEGVVRVRDVRPSRGEADDRRPDAAIIDEATGRPMKVVESSHRVARRGSMMRRERLDGRPFLISGADKRWVWLDGAEVPTVFWARLSSWGSDDAAVTERPKLSRWEGNDFTRPTGPITATMMLGRPAWEVELAPPPHKPFPLQMVVDAETGVVLQQRNDGFGSVTEWTEIAFAADLPDALFRWDGEALPPPDRVAERARGAAERRAWLESQGLGPISLRVEVELRPHEWDNDGAFQASFHHTASGTLMRRPHSDEPWDVRMNYPHNTRWSDDEWDWQIGAAEELSASQLAELRSQLDAGRPAQEGR